MAKNKKYKSTIAALMQNPPVDMRIAKRLFASSIFLFMYYILKISQFILWVFWYARIIKLLCKNELSFQ